MQRHCHLLQWGEATADGALDALGDVEELLLELLLDGGERLPVDHQHYGCLLRGALVQIICGGKETEWRSW